jgi:protein disulfide-isomerase A6
VDANDEKNSALSKKYEVQGFPTLKFFSKGQSEPLDYEGGRSEEDLVSFLNEKCRAQRKVGGGLNENVSLVCNPVTPFCRLGGMPQYGFIGSSALSGLPS